jgi:hypothetical protein
VKREGNFAFLDSSYRFKKPNFSSSLNCEITGDQHMFLIVALDSCELSDPTNGVTAPTQKFYSAVNYFGSLVFWVRCTLVVRVISL